MIERLGHPDDGYEAAEQRVMLGEAIPDLSEDERQVLALRFVDDLTQRQIAGRLGVSQMQVSRILHGALETLARRMRPPAADGVMRSTTASPRPGVIASAERHGRAPGDVVSGDPLRGSEVRALASARTRPTSAGRHWRHPARDRGRR